MKPKVEWVVTRSEWIIPMKRWLSWRGWSPDVGEARRYKSERAARIAANKFDHASPERAP